MDKLCLKAQDYAVLCKTGNIAKPTEAARRLVRRKRGDGEA